MPFVAPNVAGGTDPHLGDVVGDGECVAYVMSAAKAPPSIRWRQGASVHAALTIVTGTAIATF